MCMPLYCICIPDQCRLPNIPSSPPPPSSVSKSPPKSCLTPPPLPRPHTPANHCLPSFSRLLPPPPLWGRSLAQPVPPLQIPFWISFSSASHRPDKEKKIVTITHWTISRRIKHITVRNVRLNMPLPRGRTVKLTMNRH